MPIHCPECRFEFPEGLHPLPNQCPRCGAPLYFAHEVAPPAPKRRPNYAFLRHSPTMAIIVICVIAFLWEVIVGRSLQPSIAALLKTGATFGPAVFAGQWWRLLSAVFLHGGVLHIAFNMWALFNLGLLAEILYGRRNYVVLYLLCGLGGSVASVWWHPNSVGVGASGAIFGIAGALLPALKFQKNPRIAAALKGSLGSIAMFVVYNLAFGAAIPFIDNAAHVGGLVTGLVVGALLPSYTVEEERQQTGRAVTVFVAAFALIVSGALYARKKFEPNALLLQAQKLVKAGKVDEAIDLYQAQLERTPDDETVQVQYAALLDQAKRYQDEIAVLQKLAQEHPQDAHYQESLCGVHLKNGEADVAVGACVRATELEPQNTNYLFTLGSLYLEQKQNANAVVTFRKAYELNPNRFGENFFLGIALLQDGQRLEAAEKLRKAVELNPKDVTAQKALAAAEAK